MLTRPLPFTLWQFLCFVLLVGITILASGCATNPGLDHRIVCTLEGKAAFAETYGPLALFQTVPDANVICGALAVAPSVTVTPAAITPAASAAKGTP